MSWCESRMRSRPASALSTSMPEMSPPEQKCPPAPVTTTARMPAPDCARSSAETIAVRIGMARALRRAGWFNRTRAAPP